MPQYLEKLATNAMTRHHLKQHLPHMTEHFKTLRGMSLDNLLSHYKSTVRARLTEQLKNRIPSLRKLPK